MLIKRFSIQPRSQCLLCFQDLSRHLESRVDPGNEVVFVCLFTRAQAIGFGFRNVSIFDYMRLIISTY